MFTSLKANLSRDRSNASRTVRSRGGRSTDNSTGIFVPKLATKDRGRKLTIPIVASRPLAYFLGSLLLCAALFQVARQKLALPLALSALVLSFALAFSCLFGALLGFPDIHGLRAFGAQRRSFERASLTRCRVVPGEIRQKLLAVANRAGTSQPGQFFDFPGNISGHDKCVSHRCPLPVQSLHGPRIEAQALDDIDGVNAVVEKTEDSGGHCAVVGIRRRGFRASLNHELPDLLFAESMHAVRADFGRQQRALVASTERGLAHADRARCGRAAQQGARCHASRHCQCRLIG